MIVVSVVGSKRSGKTTAIEILTRELSKRGYRVGAVKHIPEPDFTIDTEGKDTWRFAKSGAKTIATISSDEIVVIEKTKTTKHTLETVLQRFKESDVVFVEGFKDVLAKNMDIHKIVIVDSAQEAQEAVKSYQNIMVFLGSYSTDNLELGIPHVNILRNPENVVDLIEKIIVKKS